MRDLVAHNCRLPERACALEVWEADHRRRVGLFRSLDKVKITKNQGVEVINVSLEVLRRTQNEDWFATNT